VNKRQKKFLRGGIHKPQRNVLKKWWVECDMTYKLATDGEFDRMHKTEMCYRERYEDFPLALLRQHPNVIEIHLYHYGVGTQNGREGILYQGDLLACAWEKKDGKWYRVEYANSLEYVYEGKPYKTYIPCVNFKDCKDE
jgi:hypothetical protein